MATRINHQFERWIPVFSRLAFWTHLIVHDAYELRWFSNFKELLRSEQYFTIVYLWISGTMTLDACHPVKCVCVCVFHFASQHWQHSLVFAIHRRVLNTKNLMLIVELSISLVLFKNIHFEMFDRLLKWEIHAKYLVNLRMYAMR